MSVQLIGARLGAYEVRELLGSGGMGSVYRGYDPALARDVAIKVMGASGLLPDAVARFRREARMAASLRHPHIVQVYAFGEQDDMLYMVQELLPGPTLAERIPRGNRRRMGSGAIKQIIRQLATALDYAHGRNVLHRDVKPGNALYNAAGDLVLTDFGLARESADTQKTATGPGIVMGTPGYIAPEQAVGSTGLTKGCDIYALGVLLFELLTGRLPFEADTSMGVVLKHLYDEPPKPSSLRSDLPKAVDAVVLRALRKEPDKRFPSAGALADALDAAWPVQPARPGAATTARVAPLKAPPAKTSASKAAPTPAKGAPAPAKAASTPAKATAPRDKAPPKKAASPRKATPTPAAVPQRSTRLRVGLLTACIVGILLLYGFGVGSADVSQGWQALQGMIGR
jgi:eukaryotic-like serine/threonine-protein kinase